MGETVVAVLQCVKMQGNPTVYMRKCDRIFVLPESDEQLNQSETTK